ncbi:hypothetical protein LINPERHAP2_LOCUS28931 [Linum perenne]
MKFKAFLTENGVMLLERRFLPALDKMGKVAKVLLLQATMLQMMQMMGPALFSNSQTAGSFSSSPSSGIFSMNPGSSGGFSSSQASILFGGQSSAPASNNAYYNTHIVKLMIVLNIQMSYWNK